MNHEFSWQGFVEEKKKFHASQANLTMTEKLNILDALRKLLWDLDSAKFEEKDSHARLARNL